MKKAKTFAAVATTLITLPIWFFLLYTMLAAINADRLTWFLFWIYVPLSIVVRVLSDIATSESK